MRFILTILFLLPIFLHAQDNIYFKDGKKIEAKIISISEDSIKYLRADNVEGPSYVAFPSQLLLIVFQNGYYKTFYKIKTSDDSEIKFRSINSFLITDFILSRLSISHEQILSSGKMGIRIPVSIDFGGGVISGIDINFYPKGQNYRSFYNGIKTRVGRVENDVIYDDDGNYFLLMGTKGIRWVLENRFTFSLEGGIGINVLQFDFDDEVFDYLRISAGFGIGYAF